MSRSFLSRVTDAQSLHLSNCEQFRFRTLSTLLIEVQMEKSKVDGTAIESLHELVEHYEKQHEHSSQPSSGVAEDHESTNPSEEEKRLP